MGSIARNITDRNKNMGSIARNIAYRNLNMGSGMPGADTTNCFDICEF